MYIVGFINTNNPSTYINPVDCETVQDLFTWLQTFFNKQDYALQQELTLFSVEQAVKTKKPVIIDITGFNVAVLLGEKSAILATIENIINADLI